MFKKISEKKPALSEYAQWLTLFERLRTSNTLSSEDLWWIQHGQFHGKGIILKQFQEQLTMTINVMINLRIERLKKQIREVYEFNEISCMSIHISRFVNEIKLCFFFTELNFLSQDFRKELEASVRSELNAFLKILVSVIENQTRINRDSDLDYELMKLKRVTF